MMTSIYQLTASQDHGEEGEDDVREKEDRESFWNLFLIPHSMFNASGWALVGVIPSQPDSFKPSALSLSLRAAIIHFNHRFNPHATAHRPLLGCTDVQLQLCGSDVTVASRTSSDIYSSVFTLFYYRNQQLVSSRGNTVCWLMMPSVTCQVSSQDFCPLTGQKLVQAVSCFNLPVPFRTV